MPMPDAHRSDAQRWGRIPAWWLSHPDIDADGLAVLAALSTYANGKGECWPSQGTLAAALKRSRSTINRILGQLADSHVIEVAPRRAANGGRLSSIYRLRMEPGSGTIVNNANSSGASDGTVQPRDTTVATADSPCATARHEQPDSEQNPDSLAASRHDANGLDQPDNRTTAGPDARPVPTDWTPSPADLAWARAEHHGVDLARHAQGFVLRCAAHGYRYRDIGAAWRAWLMQDTAARKAPLLSGPPPAASSRETDKTAAPRQQVAIWAAVAESRRHPPPILATPSFHGGF